jgi:hypothetical protein
MNEKSGRMAHRRLVAGRGIVRNYGEITIRHPQGIEEQLPAFKNQGIRPVAISVDAPEESADLCRKAGYTYTFLSDPNAEVIQRFDLLHPGPGREWPRYSSPSRVPAGFLGHRAMGESNKRSPRQGDARRNAESSEGIALRTLNRRAFQIVGIARYIPT